MPDEGEARVCVSAFRTGLRNSREFSLRHADTGSHASRHWKTSPVSRNYQCHSSDWGKRRYWIKCGLGFKGRTSEWHCADDEWIHTYGSWNFIFIIAYIVSMFEKRLLSGQKKICSGVSMNPRRAATEAEYSSFLGARNHRTPRPDISIFERSIFFNEKLCTKQL